ncbi:hypothetical protein C438_06182 [Haloferax denitrificans ATCC 35960]|uniref:Uncharacterized protein n=1 Tax=Haloferax denitrificans ATCC 35960 TaxID=662478 RepID=M0JD38_9EURY|nr:hypothetical protein C438_06182 [Haloferax denitrificans ATCC 35960]
MPAPRVASEFGSQFTRILTGIEASTPMSAAFHTGERALKRGIETILAYVKRLRSHILWRELTADFELYSASEQFVICSQTVELSGRRASGNR